MVQMSAPASNVLQQGTGIRPMHTYGRMGKRAADMRRGVGTWLFLLPAIAFFVGYQVYPIIRVVWFDNYIAAMNDPLMWKSLGRAALFTLMFLPGTIIFPLLLAVLVDRVTNE